MISYLTGKLEIVCSFPPCFLKLMVEKADATRKPCRGPTSLDRSSPQYLYALYGHLFPLTSVEDTGAQGLKHNRIKICLQRATFFFRGAILPR